MLQRSHFHHLALTIALLCSRLSADNQPLTYTPTAPESRSWNLDEVVAWAELRGLPTVRVDDFDDALRAAAEGSTILVTGSFHTVGDAMQRLQVDPLAP